MYFFLIVTLPETDQPQDKPLHRNVKSALTEH
jgi:hypothetical protein